MFFVSIQQMKCDSKKVQQADHRVKMKESKNIVKYLDLTRELKELWNMKVTVIPIVVDTLGIIPEGLEKRLRETGD